MALYLGDSKKLKINLDNVVYCVNLDFGQSNPFGELVETWDIGLYTDIIANLYVNNNKYTLCIDGTGRMGGYMADSIPWGSYLNNIETVIISDGITEIGATNFYECRNLNSITIPDSVVTIRPYAFTRCTSLTSIILPNSVNILGADVFKGCSSLVSITIPSGITKINTNTLSGCSILNSIIYLGTIAQWNTMVFASSWNTDTGNYIVYCTDGSITKDGTVTYYD